MPALRDAMPGAPARRTRPAAWLALPAGWLAAAAALLPGLAGGAEGERAALLAFAGAACWWPAVLWIVRSDLADFLIPDEASAAVAALGLLVAAAGGWPDGPAGALRDGQAALATGAGAFAAFWLVGAACRRLGRDALGHGDVKLAGASAVWLAPGDAALALEVAALGAIALLLVARRDGRVRDTAVPFGAFLAPAAWLVFVFGPALRGAGVLPW